MSKFTGARNPKNNLWAATGKSNPNRVIGGHKSWATRLAKANKPGEEGLVGSILKAIFGRKR